VSSKRRTEMAEGILKDLLEGRKYPTDILAIILWTTFSLFGALALPSGNIVRLVLTIPLVIFIPGYALTTILWPDQGLENRHQPDTEASDMESSERDHDINDLDRIAVSLGLSIVAVIIIGLLMNFTFGLSLYPIVISLCFFVYVSSILGLIRRIKIKEEQRYSIDFTLKHIHAHDKKLVSVSIFIILVIVITSLFIFHYQDTSNTASYTEFYILDQNRTFDTLPNNLTVNETGTVFINIRNLENRPVRYTIIAGVENHTNPTKFVELEAQIDLNMNCYTATDLTLVDTQLLEQRYTFHFSIPGRYNIVWNLLTDDQETDYRIQLWVEVT
jgi:uncharacterized membrane protein